MTFTKTEVFSLVTLSKESLANRHRHIHFINFHFILYIIVLIPLVGTKINDIN